MSLAGQGKPAIVPEVSLGVHGLHSNACQEATYLLGSSCGRSCPLGVCLCLIIGNLLLSCSHAYAAGLKVRTHAPFILCSPYAVLSRLTIFSKKRVVSTLYLMVDPMGMLLLSASMGGQALPGSASARQMQSRYFMALMVHICQLCLRFADESHCMPTYIRRVHPGSIMKLNRLLQGCP